MTQLTKQIALAEEFGFKELYLTIPLTEAKDWFYVLEAIYLAEMSKNEPAAF